MGPDYAAWAASRSSASLGQACLAQSPKSWSARQTQASPASGSTHRKLPDWPKWPNVRGEFRDPVQCGDLAVPDLEAQAPVVVLLAAEPGQHAGQAGKGDRGRLGQQVLVHQGRAGQLDGQVHQVAERADRAPGRGALQPGGGHARAAGRSRRPAAARRAGRSARRRSRRRSRCRGWSRCAGGRAGQDRVAVEGEPGRVRQQVPDRRSRRSGRLVQVEQAALHRVERGQRDEQLGHRRPAERLGGRAGRFHQARGRRERRPRRWPARMRPDRVDLPPPQGKCLRDRREGRGRSCWKTLTRPRRASGWRRSIPCSPSRARTAPSTCSTR